MATILFRDDGVGVPSMKRVGDDSYEMPMSSWLPMVDFLRNEKPVFVQFPGDDLQLMSGDEGAGEGEN
jgi:hypothetical protein